MTTYETGSKASCQAKKATGVERLRTVAGFSKRCYGLAARAVRGVKSRLDAPALVTQLDVDAKAVESALARAAEFFAKHH